MTVPDRGDAPRSPGRPRSEQADRAILDATLDLLAEVGVTALSIEAVAARAGVGKTTIYRRWPSRDALVVDALGTLTERLPPVRGESVRDDLVLLVDSIRRRSLDSRVGRILPRMVGEQASHPELALCYRRSVVEPRRERVREVLRRGVASGELRADLDVELALALVTGPMLAQVMLGPGRAGPLPSSLSARLVDAALEGMRPRSEYGSG